jgi:hypothetical protein
LAEAREFLANDGHDDGPGKIDLAQRLKNF